MPGKWHYLVIMIWIAYQLFIGIHLFRRGFLLSRQTLPERSSCRPAPPLHAPPPDRVDTTANHSATSANSPHKMPAYLSAQYLRQTLAGPHPDQQLLQYCLPAKSKVILLVVDALRYDFGVYDPELAHPLAYQNKLPYLYELLHSQPANTRLLQFTADPPTTTLQRLKALTTGTLPTFIDVGANFATDEINEDNIIDQLVAGGRRVVHMGDNTWSQLYPGRFARSTPMASFNIYDLDTVDRAVAKLLPAELQLTDWDLLVAHTLGVDHCGHKHGPQHPEMGRKLAETDRLLRDIVWQMDEFSTLVVIGDHGMTSQGDHGGESADETQALLFAYSKGAEFHGGVRGEDSAAPMRQIDLVPTLATILGVPIPYSSLGRINYALLPDRWPQRTELGREHELLFAAMHNIAQMRRYQARMSGLSSDGLFEASEEILHRNAYHTVLSRLPQADVGAWAQWRSGAVSEYLREIREQFTAVWVRFDAAQMTHGLMIVALFSVLVAMVINNLPVHQYAAVFSGWRCAGVVAVNGALAGFGWSLPDFGVSAGDRLQAAFFCSGMGNLAVAVLLVVENFEAIVSTQQIRQQHEQGRVASKWLMRVVFAASLAVCFSNSFVINEQYVLSYALIAAIVALLFALQRTHLQLFADATNGRRRMSVLAVLRSTYVRLLAVSLLAMICVRMSHNLFRCREEQGEFCVFGVTLNKLEPAATSGQRRSPFATRLRSVNLIPCVVLVIYLSFARRVLQQFGPKIGARPAVLYARYAPYVLACTVSVHFVLAGLVSEAAAGGGGTGQTRAALFGIGPVHADRVAWLTYALVAVHAGIVLLRPLAVYVEGVDSPSVGVALQRALNYWRNRGGGGNRAASESATGSDLLIMIPETEGLGAVYTTVLVQTAVAGGALVALVLGSQAASGISLSLFVGSVILVLGAVQRFQTANSIEKCLQPNFSMLIAWTLLAHHSFYATSHQATLSQIDWHAAFVGRQTAVANGADQTGPIAVLLVLLNTFGAPALIFLLYPLLCTIGYALYARCPKLIPKQSVTRVGRHLISSRSGAAMAVSSIGGGASSWDEDVVNLPDRKHSFDLDRGELNLYEKEQWLMAAVFRTGVQLMLLQGFRIFASMLACTIHCRHLMVWKIFAPRFIYEGLVSYVMFAAIIGGYAIIWRVHQAVNRLLHTIAIRVEQPANGEVPDVNRLLQQKIKQNLDALEARRLHQE